MRHELTAFQALLRQHALEHPDAVAVQGDAQRYTYRQLLDEVESRAGCLRSQPPGTFAVVLDNGPEALFWDLAALFAERATVTVPSFFSARPSSSTACSKAGSRRSCARRSGPNSSLRLALPGRRQLACGSVTVLSPRRCRRALPRSLTPPVVPARPKACA